MSNDVSMVAWEHVPHYEKVSTRRLQREHFGFNFVSRGRNYTIKKTRWMTATLWRRGTDELWRFFAWRRVSRLHKVNFLVGSFRLKCSTLEKQAGSKTKSQQMQMNRWPTCLFGRTRSGEWNATEKCCLTFSTVDKVYCHFMPSAMTAYNEWCHCFFRLIRCVASTVMTEVIRFQTQRA